MPTLAHHTSLAISNTVTTISDSPTEIGMIEVGNTTAAVAYIQIFWLASGSVTLGTTVANATLIVPASGGIVLPFDGGWKTGGTAWSIASTTTATGNTAAAQYITIWRRV